MYTVLSWNSKARARNFSLKISRDLLNRVRHHDYANNSCFQAGDFMPLFRDVTKD